MSLFIVRERSPWEIKTRFQCRGMEVIRDAIKNHSGGTGRAAAGFVGWGNLPGEEVRTVRGRNPIK